MHFVSDLHLHSKYSRAVSQDMILPTMARFAKQKGLDILTASDFTHPLWFKELGMQLEEAEEGIYKLKSSSFAKASEDKQKETYFILSTEIASIYKQGEKLRRIHNLVFSPNLETVAKINKELIKRGCNLSSDGRPIIGLSSKQLLELILEIDERCFLIPCHVWTPHFGVYGSASGFDSLEEAFEELANNIYGIETGLSSDPEMNWEIKELDNRSILSFSDAHSPAKMGREATVFDLEKPTFTNMKQAIMRKGGANRIVYTIEFYPEEGKYHFSGHRNCKVVYGPKEIKEKGNICPVCNRRLTEGVLFRLQQLANQEAQVIAKHNASGLKWYTDAKKKHPPFVKLVPLLEIIAEGMDSTVSSIKVKEMFRNLCDELDSEITILLKTKIEDIAKIAGPKIADGIERVRHGTIALDPGYDGEYGKVKIWEEEKKEEKEALDDSSQLAIF